MNKKESILLFFLTLNIILLSSCSIFIPYTAPVQQGKFIPQELIKDIYLGMRKEQVKFLLGFPDIIDTFSKDQWNYIYTFEKGIDRSIKQQKLIIIFHHGKLKKITGDYHSLLPKFIPSK